MRRVINFLIGIPIVVIAVALAVANRRPIPLSFDPFSPNNPALTVEVPLYAVIFASVIIGVVLGSIVTWMGHARHRKEARWARRHKEREAIRMADERARAIARNPLSLPSPTREVA